jgi:hypothetical protein
MVSSMFGIAVAKGNPSLSNRLRRKGEVEARTRDGWDMMPVSSD